eukprot:CAMPEP_0202960652 /NCGR_PEP_ID=MMETSP1396-20130829/4803_1 /ASSEMBLY_ACC=CAM_ASM_000872 /TAXON_ID= /ORGANISM="Pseudokeronopsis sp., Strain Brazil" /LENGTH=131 /DNA_ID=CAMNT_0049680009 /DNA_START=82 /DNA_END=479 /DNA_ORIENTATION=+
MGLTSDGGEFGSKVVPEHQLLFKPDVHLVHVELQPPLPHRRAGDMINDDYDENFELLTETIFPNTSYHKIWIFNNISVNGSLAEYYISYGYDQADAARGMAALKSYFDDSMETGQVNFDELEWLIADYDQE